MLSHEELSRGLSAWRHEESHKEEITVIAQQPTGTAGIDIIDDIRAQLEPLGITVRSELTTASALPWGRFCLPKSTDEKSRTMIEGWLNMLEDTGRIRVERRAVLPSETP